MNKEVSFPIAKLLNEKDYSWECENFYKKGKYDKKFYLTTGVEYDSDRNCIWDWNLNGGKSGMLSKVIPYPNERTAIYYSAPTIAEVVMWLYEKHGIWISVNKEYHNGVLLGFEAIIDSEDGLIDVGTFATPIKAYEEAIKYALNHSI